MLFLGLLWCVLLLAYMGVFIRMLTFCGVIWWWVVLFLLGIVILVWLISDWFRAMSPIFSSRRKSKKEKDSICELVVNIDECENKSFQIFLKDRISQISRVDQLRTMGCIAIRYYLEFSTLEIANSFLKDLDEKFKGYYGVLYKDGEWRTINR